MNADTEFSGRIIEVDYERSTLLVRYEGAPPEVGTTFPDDVVEANLRAELVNVLRRSAQSLEAAYNIVCEYSEGRAASETAQFIHADLEQVRASLRALGVGSCGGDGA